LFGQALSRRIKATILYATETGRSEMYAKKLGEIFAHAFHSQVHWIYNKFNETHEIAKILLYQQSQSLYYNIIFKDSFFDFN